MIASRWDLFITFHPSSNVFGNAYIHWGCNENNRQNIVKFLSIFYNSKFQKKLKIFLMWFHKMRFCTFSSDRNAFRNFSHNHSMKRIYIEEAIKVLGNKFLKFLRGSHRDEILSLFFIKKVRCLVMQRQ